MTKLCDILTSKQRRKIPTHIKEILNYLIDLKLSDIALEVNKHYKITWLANGKRCGISCSGTPTNYDFVVDNIKKDIKRAMRVSL